MGTELQEIMIYQSPPELGALWTEVNVMMQRMGAEQKTLIVSQMKKQALIDARRATRLKQLRDEAIIGVAIMIVIFVMGGVFMWVAYDRQRKYPQYGDGIFPKTEQQRREDEQPKIYIGR